LRAIVWTLSARLPLNWTQAIPNSDSPGVYLIFNEADELIYPSARLSAPWAWRSGHICMRGESDADVRWQGPDTETDHPRFLATISIPEGECFLAPALEGLLIETLHPKLNVHKKRK
jgi:hypothetical protein